MDRDIQQPNAMDPDKSQPDALNRDKTQLDQFLANPLELLWLLGFFNQFHARHSATVLENVANEVEGAAVVKTATPKLVDQLWLQFHYPVIKYYKYAVAQVFIDCREQFELTKHFRPRAIEARKIYQEFVKLSKLVKRFYLELAQQLLRLYSVDIVPHRIQMRLAGPTTLLATEKLSEPLLQVLGLTIHRLIVALADIERHLVSVDHTYVRPCLSYKEWRQSRDAKGMEKLARLINDYGPALDYYHDCMRIMPTVGEPYNHIGMIYNSIDDRFTALYWFIRSQFTRTAQVDVAQKNFHALMAKGWFINQLSKVSLVDVNVVGGVADLNNMLVLLCGFVYMPEVYVKGRAAQGATQFINGIPHLKMEASFFTVLARDVDAICTQLPDLFIQHLSVLFGFCRIIGNTRKQVAMKAIKRLTYRYIDTLFDMIATYKGDVLPLALLVAMRLVLAWLKEDSTALSGFHERDQLVMALAKVLNRLGVKGWPTTRPVRAYYFHEDVDLRDFSLINNRFRDCDDDAVFDSVDFMAGDFLALIDPTRGPMFLPPGCTLVPQYEDALRTAAILVVGDSVLEFNRAGFDKTDRGYVYDAKKRKASKEPKPKKKNKKNADHGNANSNGNGNGNANNDGSYAAVVSKPPAAQQAPPNVAPSLSVLASIGPLVGPADSLEHLQTQMMNHIQNTLKAAETSPAAETDSQASSVGVASEEVAEVAEIQSRQQSLQPEEANSRVLELMVDSLVEDVARVTVDQSTEPVHQVPTLATPLAPTAPTNPAPVHVSAPAPLPVSSAPTLPMPSVQATPTYTAPQPPLMPQAYPQYQAAGAYAPSASIWGPQYMSQYPQYQTPMFSGGMAPSMPSAPGYPQVYGEHKDDPSQWQFLQ